MIRHTDFSSIHFEEFGYLRTQLQGRSPHMHIIMHPLIVQIANNYYCIPLSNILYMVSLY